MSIRTAGCGEEAAKQVHLLTQAAFADQARLSPPSGALGESVVEVRADLARNGGALAWLEGDLAGCLRLRQEADQLHVRRLAVLPALRRRGVGQALMAWAETEARSRGQPALEVGVRRQLGGNLAFYSALGFVVTSSHSHPGYREVTWYTLRKPVSLAGASGLDQDQDGRSQEHDPEGGKDASHHGQHHL